MVQMAYVKIFNGLAYRIEYRPLPVIKHGYGEHANLVRVSL